MVGERLPLELPPLLTSTLTTAERPERWSLVTYIYIVNMQSLTSDQGNELCSLEPRGCDSCGRSDAEAVGRVIACYPSVGENLLHVKNWRELEVSGVPSCHRKSGPARVPGGRGNCEGHWLDRYRGTTDVCRWRSQHQTGLFWITWCGSAEKTT